VRDNHFRDITRQTILSLPCRREQSILLLAGALAACKSKDKQNKTYYFHATCTVNFRRVRIVYSAYRIVLQLTGAWVA